MIDKVQLTRQLLTGMAKIHLCLLAISALKKSGYPLLTVGVIS